MVHILDNMKLVFHENTILVKTFWNFTIFQYIFNMPQVKQNFITELFTSKFLPKTVTNYAYKAYIKCF